MKDLSIRRATPADAAACARLWVEFGRALAERMPGHFREPPMEGLPEWFQKSIAEAQSKSDELRVIAELDGEIVGLAHASMRRPWEAPPGAVLSPMVLQVRALLEDVVVSERARNRGVGRALVEHVEGWARDMGAAGIGLNSDADGPARRFYERMGYAVEAALFGKKL